jgi:hypothetical protein
VENCLTGKEYRGIEEHARRATSLATDLEVNMVGAYEVVVLRRSKLVTTYSVHRLRPVSMISNPVEAPVLRC